jgi:hypothetical protein
LGCVFEYFALLRLGFGDKENHHNHGGCYVVCATFILFHQIISFENENDEKPKTNLKVTTGNENGGSGKIPCRLHSKNQDTQKLKYSETTIANTNMRSIAIRFQ